MKDLLPLGTVVLVQEAKKSLMIVGTTQVDAENNSYDYIACPWPEGYLDEDTFFLFNHEDIETVQYIGFINAESQMFNKALEEAERQRAEGDYEEDNDDGEIVDDFLEEEPEEE